jgi:hypothetical protein
MSVGTLGMEGLTENKGLPFGNARPTYALKTANSCFK